MSYDNQGNIIFPDAYCESAYDLGYSNWEDGIYNVNAYLQYGTPREKMYWQSGQNQAQEDHQDD